MLITLKSCKLIICW